MANFIIIVVITDKLAANLSHVLCPLPDGHLCMAWVCILIIY